MIKNFKSWFVAAIIRAARTFAQTFLSVLPMGAVFIGDVNWGMVLSSAALSAIICIVTAVAGLPEVKSPVTPEDTSDKKE